MHKVTLSLCVGSLIAIVALMGCVSMTPRSGTTTSGAAPAEKFDTAAFEANREAVAKSFTDASKAGVLKESKKVIVPDFKVYFYVSAKGAAETGHALSGLGGGRTEARVSQKVRLVVDPKVMQELTDTIYAQFTADLKGMGYEVIDHAALAAEFPDYKKYEEGDKMKASPHAVDDSLVAYAPKGMKLEQPGSDVGANIAGTALSAFGTTLQDVTIRASEKMKAIRMSPVFVVGFTEIRSEGNVNRAQLNAVQSLRVLPGTQIKTGESWTMGAVKIEKAIASMDEYGKFMDASTAGDKARGLMSTMGKQLFGANTNESATYVIEADAKKFRTIALAQLKTANALMFERMKMEMKD